MEPEISSLCTQQPATCPCPELILPPMYRCLNWVLPFRFLD